MRQKIVLPKAALTPPRRLTATERVARTLSHLFALRLSPCVSMRLCASVTLHPRHADVAPARALAAPRRSSQSLTTVVLTSLIR